MLMFSVECHKILIFASDHTAFTRFQAAYSCQKCEKCVLSVFVGILLKTVAYADVFNRISQENQYTRAPENRFLLQLP